MTLNLKNLKQNIISTNENNFLEIIQEGYEASANLESIISKFEKLKTNDHVNVKLPQLTLPEFDGTTTQWPSFWASFTSSIDETNLPIIQKFIYLRNCLKGKAFKEIEGYHLIEDNYQLAIKHLKERFGDDNSIILSLYSELRKLPSAGKTVPSIRQTFIELDRILEQLKQLKEDINTKTMLMSIESKLPEWFLHELIKAKESNPTWNSESLRKEANKILNRKELAYKMCSDYGNNENIQRPKHFGNRNQNEPRHQRFGSGPNAYLVNTNGKTNALSCRFCSAKEHFTNKCDKYKTWTERIKRLKELKLCLKCFKNHGNKPCEKKRICMGCNQHHYYSVCPKRTDLNVPPNATILNVDIDDENVLNVVLKANEITEKFNENFENNKIEKTYLMGKYADVSFNNENPKKAFVFFDTGSTNAFISDKFASELGIDMNNKNETMILKTFGEKFEKVPTKTLKINLHLDNDNKKEINVKTIENMAHEINFVDLNTEISDKFPHLKTRGKDFTQKPDILLGINEFWTLFKGYKPCGCMQCGLGTMDTHIGQIVCGRDDYRRAKHKPEKKITGTRELIKSEYGTYLINCSKPEDYALSAIDPNEDRWIRGKWLQEM